ncbi:MAG: NifB/NifX family molybdenum-iron cluster-binding protein [Eubacteriales bacterium]
MKIGVPCDSKNLKDPVCISFGRAPYFLIYDTEDKSSSFTENAAADAQGGAGIKAAQTLVDLGAEAIIAFSCGTNAADVLGAGGVKMYKAEKTSVSENLAKMASGELEILSNIHPGYHGKK